jgi:hypothetical protein
MLRRNLWKLETPSCTFPDGGHLLFVFDFTMPALDNRIDRTHISHVTLDHFPLDSVFTDALPQNLVLFRRPLGQVIGH